MTRISCRAACDATWPSTVCASRCGAVTQVHTELIRRVSRLRHIPRLRRCCFMGSRKQGRCGGTCSRSWQRSHRARSRPARPRVERAARTPDDARTVAARIAALALHELDAPGRHRGPRLGRCRWTHVGGIAPGSCQAPGRPQRGIPLRRPARGLAHPDGVPAWPAELAFGSVRSLVAAGDSRRVARRSPGRARSSGALPGRLRRPATYRRNARLLPRQLPSPSRGGSSRGGRARPIRAVDRRCRGQATIVRPRMPSLVVWCARSGAARERARQRGARSRRLPVWSFPTPATSCSRRHRRQQSRRSPPSQRTDGLVEPDGEVTGREPTWVNRHGELSRGIRQP